MLEVVQEASEINKGWMTKFKPSESVLLKPSTPSCEWTAYVNGVSTRKIEQLAKSLGIETVSAWQRCKVYPMRNVMARVSQKDKKAIVEKMKQIWLQPDRKARCGPPGSSWQSSVRNTLRRRPRMQKAWRQRE